MSINLDPCSYRLVDDEGHILCNQIKAGDREVSPAICRACPIAQINCAHLRATLDQQTRTPITVRWGNGKSQVWEDPTPPLAMNRAACSAKTIPILSPRDCAGCVLRQALVSADAIPVLKPNDGRRKTESKRAPLAAPLAAPRRVPGFQPVPMAPPSPVAQPAAMMAAPLAEARSHLVAQKLIQLQEWLTKPKHARRDEEETDAVVPMAVAARPAQVVGEERRVGWTD